MSDPQKKEKTASESANKGIIVNAQQVDEEEDLARTPLERARALWSGLPTSQKIAGLVTTLLTFGGLLFIALSASQSDYQTLYGGLSAEQASQVTQALKERQIPYELSDSNTIKVPLEMVHEARVQLAGAGLPAQDNGTGFELFDRNEFGMTSFTQKVNYQRAMESELSRTISHLAAVRKARVHLVIPERSLFKDDARTPTASVVLGMKPGQQLEQGSIRAIRHLVASAVEGLDARDITLVDEQGELLAAPRQDAGAGGLLGGGGGGEAEESARVQRAMEAELEARVMALLAPLVGASGARVEANVELDRRVVAETSERFDPEKSVIRREQRTEEDKQLNQGDTGGVAGAAAQLAGQNQGQNANNTSSSRQTEAMEYEIDKTVRQVTESGPRLSRVSVAVLLDQNVLQPPVKEGETAAPAPDLAALQALVAGAVGMQEARGDRIELSMVRFQPIDQASLEPLPFYEEPAFLQAALRNGVLALIALLLVFLVARPMVKSFTAHLKRQEQDNKLIAAANAESNLPAVRKAMPEPQSMVGRSVAEIIDEVEQGGVQLDLSSIDPIREHQRHLRAEVLELSSSDLDRTSQVITQWLRTDDKKQSRAA